jgi:hypothetical protein
VTPAGHPYRLTPGRRLADADAARHVADLVRVVLLTNPAERLHRPSLGAGLGVGVLFEPFQGALLDVVAMRARGALNDLLGERIAVEEVSVTQAGESTVVARVSYRLRPSGEQGTVEATVAA